MNPLVASWKGRKLGLFVSRVAKILIFPEIVGNP